MIKHYPLLPLLLAAFLAAAPSPAFTGDQEEQHQPFWWADRPQCITLSGISAAVAPGADKAALEQVLQRTSPQVAAKYDISEYRWTRTAMTPRVSPRDPMILTYSFVPDGTPIEPAFEGEAFGNSNLYARMNSIFPGGEEQWKPIIRESLTAWGDHTGITYIESPDDGALFPDSPGVAGTRGDIRIAMHRINPPGAGWGFISYAYFPNWGDIVLDWDVAPEFHTPSNDFMLLRELIAHEHGHSLGLDHVEPLNGTKIMEAYIGRFIYELQEDDIRGGQFGYGDPYRPNQTPEQATRIATPHVLEGSGWTASLATVARPSLYAAGENDWFEFDMPEPGLLSIRLVPVGSTYMHGPEGGPVSPLDALRKHNLDMELSGPAGSGLQLFANHQPAGEPEMFSEVELAAGGPYRLRVYSSGGPEATQRYRIEAGYTPLTRGPSLWLFL